MKIKRLSGRGGVRTFGTAVPAELFESLVGDQLEVYARKAEIDGFRKGKVPMSVVRQRFGSDIEAEIESVFMESAIRQVVEEQGLIALEVVPEQTPERAPGEQLDLRFTVHSVPAFKVKPFEGLAIAAPVADVTEAEVDREISELSHMFGLMPATTASDAAGTRVDDIAIVDLFDRTDEDRPKLFKADEFISPRRFRQVWGEVADVEGIRPGEGRSFGIAPLPGSHFDRSFTLGVAARAVLKREPVSRKDLMKQLDAETEDDIRSFALVNLVEANRTMTERIKLVRLLAQLVDANPLKLPGPYVSKLAAAYDSGQAEALVPSERRTDAEELARRNITSGLVLSKIAEDHGITVTPTESAQFLIEDIDPSRKDAQDEVRRQLADPDMVDTAVAHITRNKALGLVMSRANVTDDKVPGDVLRRMFATTPSLVLEAWMPDQSGPSPTGAGGATP